MSAPETCIVCTKPADHVRPSGRDVYVVNCPRCGRYVVSRSAHMLGPEEFDERIEHIPGHLVSGLLRLRHEVRIRNGSGPITELTTTALTDIAKEIREGQLSGRIPTRPHHFVDLLVRIVGDRTDIAQLLQFDIQIDYPLLFVRDHNALHQVALWAKDLGLVEYSQRSSVKLTFPGWQRFEELRETVSHTRKAFVAMWFDPRMNPVYDEAIQPALADVGLNPIRIDREPNYNRIDAEIAAEIRRSGFVVAEVTGARPSVYYEAGFAHGLGIPVLFCIQEMPAGCPQEDEWLYKMHFDTRQYPHIIWPTPEYLRDEMKNRLRSLPPANLIEFIRLEDRR